MLKKLAVLAAALAVSAPAFADRGYRGHRVVVHQPYYVVHRPVVRPYYYRPAPRPVVVVHRPQPVYPAAALLVGAVIGAAIVHHATIGY